jgi:hypothetical protein
VNGNGDAAVLADLERALDRAPVADDLVYLAEEALWRSDPAMAQKVIAALRPVRPPQLPRRSRGRAPRTRRLRIRSGSRGDPPGGDSDDDDPPPARRARLAGADLDDVAAQRSAR